MDHQKDNQRIGQDSKGQNNGPYFANVRNKEPMTLSYVSKKSEKLTTALYMVTDIMNDQEPMKWKLREAGVELLSDILLATAASSANRFNLLCLVEKKIEKVISFLDVAWTARMMSEMNATILKKEYVTIKDTIERELRQLSTGGTMLHESFFDVTPELPKETSRTQSSDVRPPVSHQGAVRTSDVREDRERPTEIQKDNQTGFEETKTSSPDIEKKNVTTPVSFMSDSALHASEKKSVVNDIPASRPPSFQPAPHAPVYVPKERPALAEVRLGAGRADANTVARDDRRKIILALIKQKPSLTVKDIAKSIPGYSEKTIQRELLAMVAEGILMKRGERRWSTYSLVQ